MDNQQLLEEVGQHIDQLTAIMYEEIIPREVVRLRRCSCRSHCEAAAARWETIMASMLSTSAMLAGISVNKDWLDAEPPGEEKTFWGVG